VTDQRIESYQSIAVAAGYAFAIRNDGTVVRKGLPAMPFFRPTEVSDEDLDAVAAYPARAR
jgi:mono/diheme cytochrome c family protein